MLQESPDNPCMPKCTHTDRRTDPNIRRALLIRRMDIKIIGNFIRKVIFVWQWKFQNLVVYHV